MGPPQFASDFCEDKSYHTVECSGKDEPFIIPSNMDQSLVTSAGTSAMIDCVHSSSAIPTNQLLYQIYECVDNNAMESIGVKSDQHSVHNTICTANPLINSTQYLEYRARVDERNNNEENIWPSNLESYFLDALMYVPHMGRQKFSFKGKPHGRNEMIAIYIWIAYEKTLPPGTKAPKHMMRHRKQISSHIQVLKKLMHDHIAFNEIFPPPDFITQNGYSFDTNPCLISLSKGDLPSQEYRDRIIHDYYSRLNLQNHLTMSQQTSMNAFSSTLSKSSSTFFVTPHAEHHGLRLCHGNLDLDFHFSNDPLATNNIASNMVPDSHENLAAKNLFIDSTLGQPIFSVATNAYVEDPKIKFLTKEDYYVSPSIPAVRSDRYYHSSCNFKNKWEFSNDTNNT